MATLNSIKAQIAKLTKQAQAMESKAVQKVVALMDKTCSSGLRPPPHAAYVNR